MTTEKTASDSKSQNSQSNAPEKTAAGKTWLFVVAALLPCAGSLYHSMSEPSHPSLAITRPARPLQFATYMYHHGDEPVKAGATLNTEFRFRNMGTTPVTIDQVERSCGCMTPQWTKTVAPGEIGSLQVPLDMTRQTPGFHEYLLTVHYSDPKPHQTSLTIKAVFPEKMVIVQPRALFLSQRSDKPVDFKVAVSDYREDPLHVKSVSATADFVSAKIKRNTISDIIQAAHSIGEGDATLTGTKADIVGTVEGNIPAGRHHVLVTATTDDAEFPVVTVPMVVHGPAFPPGQEAKLNVEHVRLMASDHSNATRKSSVVLTAPTSWEISHAMAWPETLDVHYEPIGNPVGTKQMTRISIELDELPASRTQHGVVQLFANDGKDLVTVNVTLVWPELE